MNRVNLLLTEIALNLLGNTFYNINGHPVDDLTSLFKLDESEQSINANKDTLKDILSIGKRSRSTAAASSAQGSEASDDDDVVHVEVPEEVITVEDDDAEMHDDQLPRSSTQEEIVYQFNMKRAQSKASAKRGDSNNKITHSTPSTSRDSAVIEAKRSKKPPSYTSPNASVRLNYFKRAVMLEYERMLKGSEQQKRDYLAANRHLLTILKLDDKELAKRYHLHQKQELYTEIHTLMQFIRIIKSNDKANQDIISKVAKDILVAKSDILK